MAASNSSAKAAPAKRAATATKADTGKPKLTAKAKPAKQAGVASKTTAKTAPKAAPKSAPKPRAKKAVGAAPGQPSTVPAEQRRNYIEMAAYYIAERRGFAPGNPLEDWVQAEAEIDRLLAEGRLGG
ncbi:MAG: DUF2934 domain-containing protein [Sulfuritalea sp.]|nr:DUF2934 domain-containing protein [Sulfuritalea sp.]